MIRKALAAASLLLIGLCIGWGIQGFRLGGPAIAEPQRNGFPPNGGNNPAPNQVPQGVGVQQVQPFNIPDLQAASQLPQGISFPDGFVAMTTEEAINVSVYDRTNRSVVNISTNSVRSESFFTMSEIEGSGAGSVIDYQGHILTNYHVVEGAKQINVVLFSTDSFPAELVGQDPDNDIAILRIKAPETLLFPLQWGDSSVLKVGQHIIAIGNPFGYERTMSTGVISSLNRTIKSKTRRKMQAFIQIDAALNQGNSGGPLLNSRGELIGMNTAIATRSGDNAGIGFSIPVNTIRRVVPQLIATGRVQRPTIGIVQVFETEKGLLVVVLTPNGPAEKAGIRGSKIGTRKVQIGVFPIEQPTIDHSQSDIIVGIDGQRVLKADDLMNVVETKKPGDQVILEVVRNGLSTPVPVILGSSD